MLLKFVCYLLCLYLSSPDSLFLIFSTYTLNFTSCKIFQRSLHARSPRCRHHCSKRRRVISGSRIETTSRYIIVKLFSQTLGCKAWGLLSWRKISWKNLERISFHLTLWKGIFVRNTAEKKFPRIIFCSFKTVLKYCYYIIIIHWPLILYYSRTNSLDVANVQNIYFV